MLKKYIGDKKFYKRALALTLPIMIQNAITNFVSMLDNIMVGQVGTVQMTGVAVSNQLLFVFNLCIFGAVSGAGIFGAQFFGKRDYDGMRHTFRFKVIFCTVLTVISMLIFIFFGRTLINLYLQGEGNPQDAAASLDYAMEYLMIMLVGILPYAIVQCYSSTLREAGQTVVPMLAGITAVVVNLILNYILIFGHFGAPALGAAGAAIATVISRFVELFIVVIWPLANSENAPYLIGAYKSFYIPKELVSDIFKKGLPLMINETMYAAGLAVLNQCYSVRGLDVVAANNISQTFFNVFSTAFLSVGAAIGIILGQHLGAGENEQAVDSARKLAAFSIMISAVVGGIYFVGAAFIPRFYNTSGEIRALATSLMRICALAMPLDAYANASYFTLRSGGRVFITMLFDSCFVWAVNVPIAFILSRYTSVSILVLFAACQFTSIIKDIAGYTLVKKGIWIKNIVAK